MATKTTKSAAKKTTKKKAVKKVTTKKAAAKTTKKKTTSKKAPTKKTAAKKSVTKKVTPKKKAVTTKKSTKKATATKTTTKKASVKKAVAKKDATPKKTSSKKTAGTKSASPKSKPSSKKTTKSASKAKASKKVTAAVEEVLENPAAAEAPAKPAAKKTTTKKTKTKKTTRKKAVKVREKVVVVGKVGQAPRRTADEVAASNPFPVPPQIHESVEEASTTPSPEAKAAKKEFKVKDQIVYPAHGVGVIEAIESQDIVGTKIEVFVIQFTHEKLRLRVPTEKAKAVGMRELSTVEFVDKTIEVLQGRARIKRTMWSRRAQEYEAKINSGDLNAVAEVVRDLYRAPEQPEQSYSERQLFEAALDRMAREVAAVKNIDLGAAVDELDASLQKKQIVI